MSTFNTRQKLEKKMKRAQNVGAHLQCVKNYYVKYELKGIHTLGVTDYTN